ncbi:MAG: YmdB family metallophosphoesterase [Holosporales bacterium]|jgi:metallophosphoesterase (TIGR00282 family)|nr:YmdB family metallophosphoesterase [Holosporales bacterium]
MMLIRLLFCGDIVARAGRECIEKHLPHLRKHYKLDCVIANVDNAAHGIGVTVEIVDQLHTAGVDVCTGGNHVWDKKEGRQALERCPWLIRPYNHPIALPGNGVCIYPLPNGGKIVILQLLGSLYTKIPVENPFTAADRVLKDYILGKNISAIFVDFHAEATSEKMALAYYLDGRVSALIGTHTHIPTADTFILPKGTAYQTDAGMCGDYNSVIGMVPKTAIDCFLYPYHTDSLMPTEDEATLCGTLIDIDPSSGRPHTILPIRIGGILPQSLPTL